MPERTFEGSEAIGLSVGRGEARSVVRLSPLVPRIHVRDNKEFVEVKGFDPNIFKEAVANTAKTKLVVVDQDPNPGEFVPSGTPINVMVTVKDVIPIKSFKGIELNIFNVYKDKNIGELLVDLEIRGVKKVMDVERQEDYDKLSSTGRETVKSFLKEKFNLDPDSTDSEIKKKARDAYKDIWFFSEL